MSEKSFYVISHLDSFGFCFFYLSQLPKTSLRLHSRTAGRWKDEGLPVVFARSLPCRGAEGTKTAQHPTTRTALKLRHSLQGLSHLTAQGPTFRGLQAGYHGVAPSGPWSEGLSSEDQATDLRPWHRDLPNAFRAKRLDPLDSTLFESLFCSYLFIADFCSLFLKPAASSQAIISFHPEPPKRLRGQCSPRPNSSKTVTWAS